ncbi:MAG TPA: ABC transporter permease [Clostridia bacterium]|nr:ABC transporter permease [Clostridia bacterium]
MIRLLKCEFKKFKATYINSLSLLGMVAPVLLVLLMFFMKRHDFQRAGGYNWDKFNEYVIQFFVLMVGPIITSFISVFSVFYEYQQKTMKNLLTSPFGRIKIIFTKIVYTSVFVVLLYAVVAVVNVLCGLILGFNMSLADIADNSLNMILAGATTILLVPFMMFITLLFRNFIPAMVVTVIGTISNILTLNWEKSYFSPWAVPIDLFGISSGMMKMKLVYPLTSFCIFLAVFMLLTVVYFRRADQNV